MSAKRLVMIMGFQRSGTTALFETLSTAPGVSARHEAADDAIYDDYFLRPESEIRPVLAALPGTILLKPVRESQRRSPRAVADEYRDYDLSIVWLYRDPVNVFKSWQAKGWWKRKADGWSHQWVKRNERGLDSLETLDGKSIVVRYEDLVSHPPCVDALARRLGLLVRSTLHADSGAGRALVDPDDQALIDARTRGTLARLDAARTIRPPA